MLASLAGATVLVMPTAAAAQVDTEQAETRAVVVRRLTFLKVQDLSFGRMIAGTTSGQVRIQPNGARTRTGGVTLIDASSEHQPARFAGMGLYNQQVRIRLGSNTIQLSGPGAPMTVSNFEIGSTPTAILSTSPQTFRLGSSTGIYNFPIGGRLQVNANQAPGHYTGTFLVRLDYM